MAEPCPLHNCNTYLGFIVEPTCQSTNVHFRPLFRDAYQHQVPTREDPNAISLKSEGNQVSLARRPHTESKRLSADATAPFTPVLRRQSPWPDRKDWRVVAG